MNRQNLFTPRQLQQQPMRPANTQQQQSSGSGEFQPRRVLQPGQGDERRRQNAPAL